MRVPARLGLWRHPEFFKLWTAETISQFGSQVTALALPLVAILVLNASPLEVALLGTIEFLPFLLFALPAGVWVDRLPRRPILIVGDLGRAAALLSIPIAFVFDALSIWQLYVVGFVTGTLTVFFDVAYQSYLPALVERDQIVEGNSKLEMSRSGAQIAGPGIAGGLVEAVTAPVAILVDALSFVGSAVFVFLIRGREEAPSRTQDAAGRPRASMRQEVAEGLRYVLGHPYLRNIAAATGTSNLFSNGVNAILLVYFVRELRLDPGTIGVVFAVGNVGFLAGALFANRIAAALGIGPTIVGSMFLSAPGILLVALAPREFPIPFLVASGLLIGLSIAVYNINQVSLRQAITPERMQGRMNATMRFIVWGTIPIGSVAGGILGSTIGLQPTIWIGAAGSFLAFLPVLLSRVRSLDRIPAPLEESGDDAIGGGRSTVEDAAAAEDEGVVPLHRPPLVTPDESA